MQLDLKCYLRNRGALVPFFLITQFQTTKNEKYESNKS